MLSPHAKKAGLLGKDLLSINHLRIKYEKKVIDILRPAMPDSIALPLIYGYDEENNILIMSDVASSGTLLQDALLQGEFNPEASANIGRFLGISHRETYRKGIVIRESKEDYQHHWEIFLNMRTKGINTNAETLRELSRLYQKSLENQTTDILINMDCCPKNLFQRKDGSIGVIDFEVASGRGDPAYDLGFTLGHYFLFSTLMADIGKSATDSFGAMLNAYSEEFKELTGDWQSRVMKYAGAVLLYRISGSSPALYIPEEQIDTLKNKGSEIVINTPRNLEEIIKILRG